MSNKRTRIHKPDGIARKLLKLVYNRVRPYLPYKIAVYAGIPSTGTHRLFDQSVNYADHKRPMVEAIREYVQDGDYVIDIGGGRGTFAGVAAWQGPEVTIQSYEPAQEMVRQYKQNLSHTPLWYQCEVEQTLVGDNDSRVYGESSDSNHLDPTNIEPCDVLILDCEGAEADILPLNISPRVTLVECHPQYGGDVETIETALTEMGYETFFDEYYPESNAKGGVCGGYSP